MHHRHPGEEAGEPQARVAPRRAAIPAPELQGQLKRWAEPTRGADFACSRSCYGQRCEPGGGQLAGAIYRRRRSWRGLSGRPVSGGRPIEVRGRAAERTDQGQSYPEDAAHGLPGGHLQQPGGGSHREQAELDAGPARNLDDRPWMTRCDPGRELTNAQASGERWLEGVRHQLHQVAAARAPAGATSGRQFEAAWDVVWPVHLVVGAPPTRTGGTGGTVRA